MFLLCAFFLKRGRVFLVGYVGDMGNDGIFPSIYLRAEISPTVV
jgi:hypothetical protein